jgi:RNA polymerase sigma-70 factor (ECF subfamily)
LDEKDFIKGLLDGDSRIFKELVEKYQLPVINTCLGIVHNRQDAEDIAQDVFVEIFRSIQSFRADSKLSTWIYRIAVNKSINRVRRQKRQKWLSPLEELITGKHGTEIITDPTSLPSSELENRQRQHKLHIAMDTLPENQRIAFTLNKYEELSYHEISEVMNLSLSSVESLIHRAKVNLQKKLWSCYQKDSL